MNRPTVGLVFLMGLSACVPVDQLPPGSLPNQAASTTAAAVTYPDLDAPFATVTTSHFKVHGYRENEVRPISVTAESLIGKIGNDFGVFSYLSGQTYTIIVYKDHDEFMAKTKLPATSRSASSGSTIYTYLGDGLEPALAFELTELILTNYLDRQASAAHWLIEGAALNQEVAQLSEGEQQAYHAAQANQVHANRVPFSQMTFVSPSTKDTRRKDDWYLQVESVVHFLLNQGSGLAFGSLLNSLHAGADIDQALAANYPGKFQTLTDLENAWKYTI